VRGDAELTGGQREPPGPLLSSCAELPYAFVVTREQKIERPVPALAALPSRRLPFAAGTGIGLVGFLLLGWFTGLRGVMHALLVALAATALLPLLLVLGSVAFLAASSLVLGLVPQQAEAKAGGARARVAKQGAWVKTAYYGYARRQRRQPFIWGLLTGLGLGLVGVWSILAVWVVPREIQTVGILVLSGARIDAAQTSAQRQPAPSSDGLLHPHLWSTTPAGAAPGDAPVLDLFGRGVRYEARAESRATYTLRSLGFDGEPGRDDICVAGRPQGAAERAADPLVFIENLRANKVSWSDQAAALVRTRCNSTTGP
jgi:hypothetical protein